MREKFISLLWAWLKDKRHKTGNITVFIFSVLLVGVFGFIDFSLGYELTFYIFYLIPITLSVFFGNTVVGVFISILSATSWFLADKFSGNTYSNQWIPLWNVSMRLGYFLLHGWLFGRFLQAYETIKMLTLTDTLTGTHNSRYFFSMFERELKIARRTQKEFTVVYIDLDNFKSVNDVYGHLTGDLLLKEFVHTIKSHIRPYDIMARLGGDEFALLLPQTGYEPAGHLLQRLKVLVNAEMASRNWPVTMSMGAISYSTFDLSIENMINKADQLMYEVKRQGKNSIRHLSYN